MKWPVVKRTTLEAVQCELRTERRTHAEVLARERKQHRDEVDELLKPLTEKIINIEIRPVCNRYQFCMELDTDFVESAMHWGNSDREIYYLADCVGRQCSEKVAECLRVRNYVR